MRAFPKKCGGSLLPGVFGTVSRWKTPAAAVGAVVAWAVLMTLVFGAIGGPEPASSWFSFIGTLFTIAAYALVVFGVVKFYWQHYRSEFNWIRNAVVPAIALVGIGWVAYGNVYPVPSAPFNYFIYLTVVVIAVGAVIAGVLARLDPQRMQAAGRLFAAPHGDRNG